MKTTLDLDACAKQAGIALVACNNALRKSNLDPTKTPRWCLTARPWLSAIYQKNYGFEDPVMAVLYALNNLQGWRGEKARQVKKALNDEVEKANARDPADAVPYC